MATFAFFALGLFGSEPTSESTLEFRIGGRMERVSKDRSEFGERWARGVQKKFKDRGNRAQ